MMKNFKDKKIYFLDKSGLVKTQLFPARVYAYDGIVEFYKLPDEYEDSIYLMYFSELKNLIFITKDLYLEIIENDSVYSFVDTIVDKRNRSYNSKTSATRVICSGQIPTNLYSYNLVMSAVYSSFSPKHIVSKEMENNMFYVDAGHRVYTIISYKNCVKPMFYRIKKIFE